ncbi:MAG: protein kinase domain-containing protein, partial [Chthoniobacterales bacterium]
MSEAIQQIIESCPSCGQPIDVTGQEPYSEVVCPGCGATMRARLHFNNFTLLEMLGEGGMGSVFKAVDNNLQRKVALKILKRSAGSTQEDWAKLAAEARLTAAVNHPNVVKVFSFGEDHGQFYLAMELVEKGSLDGLMVLQTRVAEAQVLDIGIQIAEGLQAAFEHGLIHRDIKPGNILFANARLAKIVDFGLARVLSEEAQEAGEIWGTPFYVAPE